MDLNPYLNFNGDCAEAFAFYAQTFGARILEMQTHGDSAIKDQVPPEWHSRVLHARLQIGEKIVMASDAPPDHYAKPQGMTLSLQVPTPAEGERIFTQLSDRGTVTMPFGQTFWSSGFGMLVDRFGIPWMVNTVPAA